MTLGRNGIFLILFGFMLSGCSGGDWQILSSTLSAQTSLRPAYKSSAIVPLVWDSSVGVSADYVRLEYSILGTDEWHIIQSNQPTKGSFDWSLSGLAEAEYQVRMVAVRPTSEQVVILGTFIVDDQPPVVGADQTVIVTEDTIQAFVLNTPTDNDKFVIKWVSAPARGNLLGCLDGTAELNCSFMPKQDTDIDDSWTYKVVDRAGNESAVATVTFDLQPVNDIPVILTQTCSASILKHNTYSCVVVAADVDLPAMMTLTYRLGVGTTCGWMTINAATGEVGGVPLSADIGTTCAGQVEVEDDAGGISAPLNWTVTVQNGPPVIHVTGAPFSLDEDSALTTVLSNANVSSLEEGVAGATYALVTPTVAGDRCVDVALAPASTNLAIDPATGAVSFAPRADYQGVCQLRISLTDSTNQVGYANVAITVNNLQDAPSISNTLSSCGTALIEDVAYSCTITVTDPDPEIVTVTRGGSDTCSWLSMNVSNQGRTVEVSGTPRNGDVGSCDLSITATDPQNATATGTTTLNITNTAPVLTIGTPLVLTEDSPSFSSLVEVLTDAQVQSTDEGSGTYSLIYTGLTGTACNDSSVISIAADFAINAATGAVSIKPLPNYFGTCYAKIQFDDGNGQGNSIVSSEIAIIVNAVNDAPTISAPSTHEILLSPSATASSSFDVSVDVGPSNENSQTASLICTNSNPTRLTVDCSATRTGDGSMTVSLQATAGVDATATITVKAKDNGGGTDESAAATITVSMTDAVVLAALTSDVSNYNVYDHATSEYGSTIANSSRTFLVTIQSGIKVYSSDPALPALRTGSLISGARVRIINHGVIVGAAGAGGVSAATGTTRMGQHGGTALKVDNVGHRVTVLNDGMILGGGGGGGRGGTDNSDAGAGGAGGAGEGPFTASQSGAAGASAGGGAGARATSSGGGTTAAYSYMPSNGIAPTHGSFGQGGSSCLIGSALYNDPAEASFGRGGFGAGFGGGAGACATTYGGGGGGGYFGGGGGSGGLADNNDAGNLNTDTNGYNGGHGGAAIEVPSTVTDTSQVDISIAPESGSIIAGAVWNDISGNYLTVVTNDSDVNARELFYSATAAQNVNNPSNLKIWNNGRGKVYR